MTARCASGSVLESRHRWRPLASAGWRYRVLLLLFALLASGSVCDKPDWLTALEHKLDVAVPQLEDALDHIAKDLPAAVDKLDAVAGKRLAELDATLRDAVDGLNHVLDQDRAKLDAALAARVQQLAQIAQVLAADVHGIALGLTTRISASVDALLLSTRAAAQKLLADLGVQIARVETEGNQTVAQVYSQAQDLIVRVVGVVLLLVGLIAGALMLIIRIGRRRALAFGLQLGGAAAIIATGLVLVASAGVRRKLARIEPVVIDHTVCPQALADGAVYVGRYATKVTPEAVVEASTVLPSVASCLVMGGSQELVDLAQARLAEIRRMLGITRACLTSSECGAGLTCDPAAGACIRQCHANAECGAGEVCHASEVTCGPPCTGTCPGGAACVSGVCQAAASPTIPGQLGTIGGGFGWQRATACARDAACMQIIRSPAREAMLHVNLHP